MPSLISVIRLSDCAACASSLALSNPMSLELDRKPIITADNEMLETTNGAASRKRSTPGERVSFKPVPH